MGRTYRRDQINNRLTGNLTMSRRGKHKRKRPPELNSLQCSPADMTSAKRALSAANRLVTSGDYAHASEMYRIANDSALHSPFGAIATNNHCVMSALKGDLRGAADCFRSAMKLDPM